MSLSCPSSCLVFGRRLRRCVWGVLATIASQAASASAAGNLLVNAQFEQPPVGGLWVPAPGVWMGDPATAVSSTGGVRPLVGTSMLQFLATTVLDTELGLHDTSRVHQIIDLSAHGPLIDSGNARLYAVAHFNRIGSAAGVETYHDRRFELSLRGFHILPSTQDLWFRDNSHLATGPLRTVSLISDDDVRTWEPLKLMLPLHPGTRLVVLTLAAVEDVNNDFEAPEFAGHFSDATFAELVAIPEPGVLGVLAYLAVMARCGSGRHRR